MTAQASVKNGEEYYETYYSHVIKKNMVAYDYRTLEGELFSTVATSLEKARQKRDEWLSEKGEQK